MVEFLVARNQFFLISQKIVKIFFLTKGQINFTKEVVMFPVSGTSQEIQAITASGTPSPTPLSIATPMSDRSTPSQSPRSMISVAAIQILKEIHAVFRPSQPLCPSRILVHSFNIANKNRTLKTREAFIYDEILVRAGQSEVRGVCWIGGKKYKPFLLLTPKRNSEGRLMYSEAEMKMHMCAAGLNIAPKLYPCRRVDGTLSLTKSSIVRFANQGDLLLFFEKNTLNSKILIEIAINMAIQVDNLHLLKIYHRDIKPENFLVHNLDSGIHIFLSDYGLATREQKFSSKRGTKGYTPPEYASFQESYDGIAADQFALGATIFAVVLQKSLDRVFEHKYKTRFTISDQLLDYDGFSLFRDKEIEALIDEYVDSAPNFEPVRKALKGLLKTNPMERISIKEAISLLTETVASL